MRKKSNRIPQKRSVYGVAENIYQKFSFLVLNEDFQKQIKLTRRLKKMPIKGFKSKEAYGKWELKNKYIKYINQVITIRKKASGFSRQYNELFCKYFLYNVFDVNAVPKRTAIYNTRSKQNVYDDRRYWIEIFPNTTEEDLLYAFAEFQNRMGEVDPELLKKPQPNPLFEIDMRIMELIAKKTAVDKIIKVINKEFISKPPQKIKFDEKYLNIRIGEIEKKIAKSYKNT